MATITQKHRLVAVKTTLGEDVLVFGRMVATEELGRLFEFKLELFSEKTDIKLTDVLGENMTVRLELPYKHGTRYFNGFVTRFSYQGMRRLRYGEYHATLSPWLWFLTRTADCRIFQNQTVPAIIKEVFSENGFTDFKDKLSGSYRQWEYCVQYRETDFNFVSRLMEQEGIYYYFIHENGKHTLVLADAYSSHGQFPGYEEIPYFPPDTRDHRERDHLSELNIQVFHQPGAYALNDYDFKAPRKNLRTQVAMPKSHALADFEIYDYPGEYTNDGDGNTYSRIRLEELLAQHEIVQARGNAAGLGVGYLFSLTNCPREDLNRENLIVSATHEVESDAYQTVRETGVAGKLYQGQIKVIKAKQPYRAPRVTPKPVVRGPQTAVVVGPQGEEIYTDPYGRVKCQFHWDRYGKADENSSCWIRVSQTWAGKQWGAMHIPRIGLEVIVDFLEGDPDQPIITGRVYNGASMPPYGLPAHQTVSGIISRSSKGAGAANFNEIRFEDKKGEEQFVIHAERNMDILIEKDRKELVEANSHSHVKGARKEKIDGEQSLTVGMSQQEKVGNKHALEAGQEIHLKAGMKVIIEAGLQLTIQGAGGFIDIGPAGITIQGILVKINSGGAAGTGSGSSPEAPEDPTV